MMTSSNSFPGLVNRHEVDAVVFEAAAKCLHWQALRTAFNLITHPVHAKGHQVGPQHRAAVKQSKAGVLAAIVSNASAD